MWLGHYQVYFLVAFLLLSAPPPVRGMPGFLLECLHWVSALAFAAAGFAGLAVHRKRLCERCISSAPVLDPQGAVDRWRLALRLGHKPVLLLAAVVPAIAVVIAGEFDRHLPSALFTWTAAWLMSVLAALNYATWQHQRLQLWCPWCPRDDGGEDEAAPVPDPGVPAVR